MAMLDYNRWIILILRDRTNGSDGYVDLNNCV